VKSGLPALSHTHPWELYLGVPRIRTLTIIEALIDYGYKWNWNRSRDSVSKVSGFTVIGQDRGENRFQGGRHELNCEEVWTGEPVSVC